MAGAAIRIERILNLARILFCGKKYPCRHCEFRTGRRPTLMDETVASGRPNRANGPDIGCSQERPSFDGLCPAMTENGRIINANPLCAASTAPTDCDRRTAIDVVHGLEASNEIACGLGAQMMMAQTPIRPKMANTLRSRASCGKL